MQKLLGEDPVGLRGYGAAHLPCPLSFDLVRSAGELKKSEMDACIGLVEKTSGRDYRASSIGWNPRKKREEMLDTEMVYLLVRQGAVAEQTQAQDMADSEKAKATPADEKGSPQLIQDYASVSDAEEIVGFISFMFTYDDPPHDDYEVVYIYEIHLHERLRGQGLGSNLIKFVEQTAQHCGIAKTMLTVFTANEGAKRMYERMGYGRDECSPKDRVMRNKTVKADYVIMSKEMA
ncbi:acyl-CoA N-acyltransferase [Clathrospora elynae]|uniref:N-alpha-acetyltransferase 40 n=1 Tax=Clathrospora elynae TaxID=706981 RepID=A0A6A5SE66_9PLEO|nr:acyl-CoA N-acyltransferase [Clathrospora elynae]